MLFFLLSNLLIQTMGQDGKRRSKIHVFNHDIAGVSKWTGAKFQRLSPRANREIRDRLSG
jgi:hypothetical protein